MSNRLPSEHKVKVLNLKEREKHIASLFIERGDDLTGARFSAQFEPIGLVADVNGKHYLIDNEGCGSGVPLEDKKDEIFWCKNVYDENDNIKEIGIEPIAKSTLDLVDVMSIPVEKVVRLDEFVRVFGNRLDRNCRNWDRFLSGIVDKNLKPITKEKIS